MRRVQHYGRIDAAVSDDGEGLDYHVGEVWNVHDADAAPDWPVKVLVDYTLAPQAAAGVLRSVADLLERGAVQLLG